MSRPRILTRCIDRIGVHELDEAENLDVAILDILCLWHENNSDLGQCFVLSRSDNGKPVATIIQDLYHPDDATVTYHVGRIEKYNIAYNLDDDGRYLSTTIVGPGEQVRTYDINQELIS